MLNRADKKRVSFYTLGCRLNQSETALIERDFKTSGYDVVDFNRPADMVVINTCTVTEGGDADTRRLINKASRINPHTRIALIGCQAQVQKEKISDHPNVKWIVGNATKMDLKSIVEELERRDAQQRTPTKHVITPTIPRDAFTHSLAAIDDKHTRVNLKVQDGCDFFCSFCEIPYARGRARSREFDNIVQEARALVSAGHKEIILTGINVGTYRFANKTFIDIITALESIEGLERIRISSIEPTTIPNELIDKMARSPKLCRYLHIPLQSGSDKILRSMKRKYTYDEFLSFIEMARQNVPEICIGTDVIVGFPGETDGDFNETLTKLKEAPVDYFHVFSYSERYMAKSQRLSETVPSATIKERSRLLRELSARKRNAFYRRQLGCRAHVIFETQKNGQWTGVSDNYIRVFCDSDKDLTNTSCDVILKETTNKGVRGRVV